MIVGAVVAQEARIRLTVRGFRGRERRIEAVVDTGFTGTLTLPRKMISALALKWRSTDSGILADGSDCIIRFYEAGIVWDGRSRLILVAETESEPLVGMALLSGYQLNMRVVDGGQVTIRRMA